MYLLIVSHAPHLPVDLCVASAMLGHAAWVLRPEELRSGNGARPSMIILDQRDLSALPRSVAAVRDSHPDVPIAVLTEPRCSLDLEDPSCFSLVRPVTREGLREVISQSTQVTA